MGIFAKKDPTKIVFLRTKTWISWFSSLLNKDRGSIPDNIGNNLIITTNCVISPYAMSSLVRVDEMSLDCPTQLIQRIGERLRRKSGLTSVHVSAHLINTPINISPTDDGLENRMRQWEQNLVNTQLTKKEKERTAILYRTGETLRLRQLYNTRFYLKVSAPNGSVLRQAEKEVTAYLMSLKLQCTIINDNIKSSLKLISIAGASPLQPIKDIPATVQSTKTLSQLMPNTASVTPQKGLFMGTNLENYSPFFFDLDLITAARNFYLIAESGKGKTVMGINLAQSAAENGYRPCIWDIKGNEFDVFIHALGGVVVDLSSRSGFYINSIRMLKTDTTDSEASFYFKDRVTLSKQTFSILSRISDKDKLNMLDVLLSKFFDTFYLKLGVESSNRTTWDVTEKLDIFIIFEAFKRYCSADVRRRYPIATDVIQMLTTYMTTTGELSHIFSREFNYEEILNAPAVSFSFGLFKDSGYDEYITSLKFLYLDKLNGSYTTNNFNQGIRTFKVLEESQIIVSDEKKLIKYVEEFTLRRSQLQTTLILGNSIKALFGHPLSAALIENITGYLIGQITATTKKEVYEYFELEEFKDLIDNFVTHPDAARSFIFFDKMSDEEIQTPVLKIFFEEKGVTNMYTPDPGGKVSERKTK